MQRLLALLLFPAPVLCGTRAQLLPEDETPLRTEGRYIVGRRGERVKWACVNWYGAYSETAVVGGLEEQPLDRIVERIVDLGFNCVRLCYSTQAQLENPVVLDANVAANPQFFGKRFFDVWDAAVAALTAAGLMVIINNQLHRSGWCCHYTQEEGLWYVPGYPEHVWIESLVNMTVRYESNPLVVAIDLRNEVHDYRGTSLTWGDGNVETDWAAAASRAGNAVLAANPNVLVVVMALCFGMDLRPAREHPLRLDVANRVVYEVHNYLEYQAWSLISQSFISWLHIRLICVAVLLGALLASGLLLWSWYQLGHVRPPRVLLVISSGAWLCGLGSVAACVCKGLFIGVSYNVPSCGYWGRRDVVPAMIGCTVVAVVGFALVAVGIMWLHRRGGVAVEDSLDTSSDDSEESVSLDERTPPTRARPPKWGCARGCGSCRILYRWATGKGPRVTLPAWDCGMCCGLQCLVLCSVIALVFATIFGFACFATTYGLLEGHFDSFWGFVLDEGYDYTAPVWLGEFGNSVPGFYWNNLMHYANQRDVDFAYWAINGKKWATGYIDVHEGGSWVPYEHGRWENETFGLLGTDYETVRRAWQLLDLQALMLSPARWRPRNRACSRSWSSACGG